eukprot:TRINITY_DN9804_c0_g1_i1.p1 TRINITY_DN9804_c0_g1~~TRINITY_DN9804_c0_g1_i1.p1  ORF type:complete len:259 (-),score=46.35 TRINITY_DN9804_c0_g1_i1:59-736(-)
MNSEFLNIRNNLRKIEKKNEEEIYLEKLEKIEEEEAKNEHKVSTLANGFSNFELNMSKMLGPPSRILNYLYLGSGYNSSENDIETLNEIGITAIINVANKCPLTKHEGIEGTKIPIKYTVKGEQNQQFEKFENCHEIIRNVRDNNGKILVHCMRGKSRSVVVVLTYLMKEYSLTYQQAFQKIKNFRPVVNPHQGIRNQAKYYYQCLLQQQEENNNNQINNSKIIP